MGFPLFIEEYVLLAIFAGVLAVDDRAGWQSLIAHPVFAALPIGWLTGELRAAMFAGVALELVWLSIIPMRGTRRADTVAGTVLGIGTTCLILRHTGDPRVLFIVSTGVLIGLVAGQGLGYVLRMLNRFRENRLGDLEIPNGGLGKLARHLLWYHLFSVSYVAVTSALVVFIAFPPVVFLTERFTAIGLGTLSGGAVRWLELMPAFGIAALIQNYWHKQLNRYLVLATGIVMVILWFR